MHLINNVKEKVKRHKERHKSLDYQYLFSDSIHFLNLEHWNSIAKKNSIFLSQEYFSVIEKHSPKNTSQRYAIAYSNGKPLLILACQIADIRGECLIKPKKKIVSKVTRQYKERVLVCGNLISSGLHGVAFAPQLDQEMGWRIVAEILYKIRRSEKISGKIDFVLIKDLKGNKINQSKIMERFSYRKIQTDPDMVLTLGKNINSFDDYLGLLNSKYRNRVKKIIKNIKKGGFSCQKMTLTEETEERLYSLYMQVEEQSKTRLATLSKGYFLGLSQYLGENFGCYGILKENEIVGFITIIKDHEEAVSYYVGFDYQINKKYPLYFRLLQLVIESAADMKCKRVLFGRSALEPKANLGAKPVDVFLWARHRVPTVNFFVRQIFQNIPYDSAPERKAIK